MPAQADVPRKGFALQCRITTEDPANGFVPDYGRLTAYRSPGGFGVPLFAYEGERKSMDRWADAKSEAELAAYRREFNERSLDGLPTGLPREAEGAES